ncbi:sigma-70 family RNA polymerase sigma factor [Mucilaginibacter sp. HC2]|nr:sigma-70 family RNA polymerase sigma factor [Mucilaginibacter inviolabilis]
MMKSKKIRLPENVLIQDLKKRNHRGISALYDMYSAALFGVISRIISDTHLSEDILQETFIRIWQAIDQYDTEKGRLFTWMVNIARNLAIDRLRSKSYRNDAKTSELEACEDIGYIIDLDRKVDYFTIKNVSVQLSLKEQKVIDLIYFQGYTHVETADTLQIPLGSVKTVLCRAVRRLRGFYHADILLAS